MLTVPMHWHSRHCLIPPSMPYSTTRQAVSQAICEAVGKLFLWSGVLHILTAHKVIEVHHYAFLNGTWSFWESMHNDPLSSDHHNYLVTRKSWVFYPLSTVASPLYFIPSSSSIVALSSSTVTLPSSLRYCHIAWPPGPLCESPRHYVPWAQG